MNPITSNSKLYLLKSSTVYSKSPRKGLYSTVNYDSCTPQERFDLQKKIEAPSKPWKVTPERGK